MKTMKTRQCPVTPDVCEPITGWDAFIRHIYVNHTDPSRTDPERLFEADRLLKRDPAPSAVVPKVTAFDETNALWAVMNSDPDRARGIIASMTYTERAVFEMHLSALTDLIGGLT